MPKVSRVRTTRCSALLAPAVTRTLIEESAKDPDSRIGAASAVTVRGNSVATRNTRLAAIHSLFRYASLHAPEHAELISRVQLRSAGQHEQVGEHRGEHQAGSGYGQRAPAIVCQAAGKYGRHAEIEQGQPPRLAVAVRGGRLALPPREVGPPDLGPGAPRGEMLQVYGLNHDGGLALHVWFDVEDIDAAIAELRRATKDRPSPSPGADVKWSRRFLPGLLVTRQHAREVGVAVTPT